MEHEEITLEIGNKVFKLRVKEFDTELDIDDLLVIDINNPLGDIITFPVLFNRIGLLKADQQQIVSRAKMELNIYEANLMEQKRKSLVVWSVDSKGEKKGKWPTVAEVENAVKTDLGYQNEQKKYFRKQRDLDVIDSLYWSAKSKDGKLDRISEKLRPEEFSTEILEEEINGVLIRQKKSYSFGDK